MKKLIIIAFITLLMVATVFATTPAAAQVVINAQKAKQKVKIVQVSDVAPTLFYVEAKPVGLENAQIRVRKQAQKDLIGAILEKIELRKREKLGELTNLEIEVKENDSVEAEGLKDVHFLGLFKVKRMVKFTISSEGEITRVSNPLDFLFTETTQFT